MKAPNTSMWTVEKYLTEVYVPQKTKSVGLKERTARAMHTDVRSLNLFAGHKVKLREVTDELLDKFVMWCREQGYADATSNGRKQTILVIMRHWRPSKFPPNTAPSRHGTFLEIDVPGSLEKFFQDEYRVENTRLMSSHTVQHYGKALRRFTEFLGHTASMADLNDSTVAKFLRWLTDVKGVKPVTANGEAKQIKAMWNWAAKKRYVEHFPTIGKLPEPEVVPVAWTEDEMRKLIAACDRHDGMMGRLQGCEFWSAFHYVLWDTGERTSATLALTWAMLDAKTGHLTVPAEIRKGGRKAMVYRLKAPTLARLQAIRSPVRDVIFETRHSRSFFYSEYRELVKLAGLPWVTRKSGPQKVRRTFASFITAAGGDATAALRHSTRRVTEDSYNDPRIARTTPPNELLFDLKTDGEEGDAT